MGIGQKFYIWRSVVYPIGSMGTYIYLHVVDYCGFFVGKYTCIVGLVYDQLPMTHFDSTKKTCFPNKIHHTKVQRRLCRNWRQYWPEKKQFLGEKGWFYVFVCFCGSMLQCPEIAGPPKLLVLDCHNLVYIFW